MPAATQTSPLCVGFIAGALIACGVSPTQELPDPRAVLSASLSHGIGASPFDSPLLQDSIAAAAVVSARKCIAAVRLRQRVDAAQGGSLVAGLVADGVLVERGDRICATFPILIGAERAAYDRVTRQLADEMHELLSPDLAALLTMVGQRGWQDWGYHFVWSQLFDSQFAWADMMERDLVHPLGHLTAWSIFPDHPFRSGTNYYPDSELRDQWLMVSWRGGGSNSAGIVGQFWPILYDAAGGSRPLTSAQQASLAGIGLVDDLGQLQVPVLRPGDELLETLRQLASTYIHLLQQRMPLDTLIALTGVDRRFTFGMAYHDVSWGIVEALVRSGDIRVPPALSRPATPSNASMRGVVAVVPAHAPFVARIRAAIKP